MYQTQTLLQRKFVKGQLALFSGRYNNHANKCINDAIVNTANDLCTSIICTSLLKILIPVLSPVLLKLITKQN